MRGWLLSTRATANLKVILFFKPVVQSANPGKRSFGNRGAYKASEALTDASAQVTTLVRLRGRWGSGSLTLVRGGYIDVRRGSAPSFFDSTYVPTDIHIDCIFASVPGNNANLVSRNGHQRAVSQTMEHTVARAALMPRFCPLPSSVYLHLLLFLLLLLFFLLLFVLPLLLLRSPPSWSATTGFPISFCLPILLLHRPPPRRSSSDKPPATAAGDIMTARPQTSNS